MTIYFNQEKQAFAYEIENPIANVEDEIWENFAGSDKWDIVEGEFKDISQTDEYLEKIRIQEKKDKIEQLTAQIERLDKKRVRALAEPELKDPEGGETWLDFYTDKIKELRNQINNL